MSTETTVATTGGKFLGLRLGSEEFGIEILRVREIIGILQITPVPQSPSYVRGVINLRGRIIPVVDLRRKFGMEAIQESERTCIIVVDISRGGGNVQMGVLVDAVSEVLNIRAEDIEPTPTFDASFRPDFTLGIAKVKGTIKLLLDIQNILGSDEVASAALGASSHPPKA